MKGKRILGKGAEERPGGKRGHQILEQLKEVRKVEKMNKRNRSEKKLEKKQRLDLRTLE